MLKPQAGAYRPILVDNLKDKDLATSFANRDFSLGIVSSFVGNVLTVPALVEPVAECLRSLPDNTDAQYYLQEIEAGRIAVVARSNSVFTADYHYRSGELFFTT